MRDEALLQSLKYRTNQLVQRLMELDSGERTVFLRGENVTEKDADQLRHRIRENMTIINRLRGSSDEPPQVEFDIAS